MPFVRDYGFVLFSQMRLDKSLPVCVDLKDNTTILHDASETLHDASETLGEKCGIAGRALGAAKYFLLHFAL